ncbi:hypothetical protein BEN47_06215 [Hymenobacter lapidarius]|uniref:Uncharacterized protein n=1 Tax=Hymenobacter lapidarius TaxID=1908237 RepID=A0A1G1SQE9_9BACT|nr:hypothetical protein [Hymenobacter lapidarius]OGX80849.1 hypothetical protein BEN47_06215 [Hymenobacter lapidarius]
MSEQEPEYRAIIRNATARLAETIERLQAVHLTLAGAEVELVVGNDWAPLAAVPGVETRMLKDAFLLEARYAPGTESPGTIVVPEAVYVLVEAGVFWLGTDEQPLQPYRAGQYKYLPPGQPHRWRCEGAVLNLLPFVPASCRPPLSPDPCEVK